MEEHKNIDRLYQEKFKDFEVFPEPIVWKNIEKNLMKNKKKRIIPLWLRLGIAAAILLGFITTGFWIVNQQSQPQPNNSTIEISTKNSKAIESDRAITDDTEIPAPNERLNTPNKEPKAPIINVAAATATKKATAFDILEEQNSTQPQLNAAAITTVAQLTATNEKLVVGTELNRTGVEKEQNSTTLLTKTSLFDAALALAEEDEGSIDEIEKIEPNSKWSIGSNIAPVFYNSIGKGSPIDANLANNEKAANTGLSYGIKVNYKVTDRFSLQSGINTVELGYETQNAAALISSSLVDGSNSNINAELVGVGVEVVSTRQQSSETFSQRSLFDNSGKIDQSFNYLELPVEAKYALVQKKLGINLVGGFSTYVLYQNNISVTSFGKTTSLGEASNINTLNFSGNVGLDLNYSLSKKLYFNTSPMLKYQFNTFSGSSGGFKPYFIGIYAGLNFRF